MFLSRRALALSLPDLIGANVIRITSPQRGWPALAEVQTKTGSVEIALFVGPIGKSHRARDAVERRFQNPGSNRPIVPVGGALPVLLGVWGEEGGTVLVGMSAMRRLGRGTRHSLFMPLNLLRIAKQEGWAEHESESKEQLIAFAPQLLPKYIERLVERQAEAGWSTARL